LGAGSAQHHGDIKFFRHLPLLSLTHLADWITFVPANGPGRRVVPADGESGISAPRWFPGLAGTSSITDDFYLGFQINSALGSCSSSNQFDQLENVLGGGLAIVDNKIAVLRRDERTADTSSFQAQFINEFARGD